MKKAIFKLIVILFPFIGIGQDSLNELLEQYNTESIPYITVKELEPIKNDIILFDARELVEYQTSHLKGALHVGYDHFDVNKIVEQNIPKESKIVVYCSLGIRSEDISEKLKEIGYTNVYNLYGGIFEWKNEDNEVVDTNDKETNKVHAFSKEWGKWLLKGKKVYKK
ncbi:rhodanese-like domain-containing protein [Aquimarina litoralis]|uniref:rhodanese-like domain-containing protein n=1 Tax=Aquimarina litoralis TaxID=584605 RepID=UPI001C55DF36|nr:rhodanese-like domain-containing protein [Aquimarina litoralis]MBW1295443.1 rhodanese-like domain-containing protein [Aquimarina litoralis]